MAKKPLPPLAVLRNLFIYDPDTGRFTWRSASGRAAAGAVAGCVTPLGYVRIKISGSSFWAHRIAYCMHCGIDPGELQIDHINGIRSDNRIDNLRLATASENQRNRGLGRNNKSGVIGCARRRCGRKREFYWRVTVGSIHTNRVCLGQAIRLLRRLREEGGYHVNHGRRLTDRTVSDYRRSQRAAGRLSPPASASQQTVQRGSE